MLACTFDRLDLEALDTEMIDYLCGVIYVEGVGGLSEGFERGLLIIPNSRNSYLP